MNQILIQIILGIIQGVTEWLPISSSGMVTLANTVFFGVTDVSELLRAALFLHLGTLLAALIYFRKEIIELTKTLFKYKYSDQANKKTLNFLIIATIISGIIGLIILFLLTSLENYFIITGKSITFFVGVFLLFTGIIQIKIRNKGIRKEREIKDSDGYLLGLAQGLASLPGVSRSGITISTLLLRKFDDTTALRLSFLMSIPIVLIGNLFLNLNDFALSSAAFYGLLASFVFGLLTIHILMKLSKKINFGWFVLVFAILMLLGLLVV